MRFLRKISILMSLALVCVMTRAAEYELTAADITITQGESATLAIELKNAGDVVGFQCDMSLPEGVTIAGELTMLRHTEGVHALVKKEQGDGSMRVMVYSNPNTPFTENSGAVLNVPLEVTTSVGAYAIKLQNSVVTAPGAVAYYVEDAEATLTVKTKSETVAVESVKLNKSALALLVGGSEQLTATVSPDNAADKTVTWSSSDSKVASVDATGKVTAVGVGTATITAKSGNIMTTCKVAVSPVTVTLVKLNKNSLALLVGASEQLTATVYPDNAADKTVTWSSSDSKVASVDATGKVTAVGVGTVTITAKSGDKTAVCSVKVSKGEQTITWEQTFEGLKEGDVVELNAEASSGLDVVYTVILGDATIEGNMLTVGTSEMIIVRASQPGNEAFNAASNVTKTIHSVSGIDGIQLDAEKAKYYDLTGCPVENPGRGIYIKVEKGKSTKVVL